MQRTQFIIVRHGQTEWNIAGIRQGHLDSRLTEKGVLRPRRWHSGWRGKGLPRFTAAISAAPCKPRMAIADLTGHEIVTDARLRERHLGIFQGLNADEICRKVSGGAAACCAPMGPDYVIPGRREHAPASRAQRRLSQRSRAEARGETIVVVTHGGVVSGFFRHTLEIPLDAPRRFEFVNAGINVFVREDENWMLLTWGDVSHLAPGAASEGDDP